MNDLQKMPPGVLDLAADPEKIETFLLRQVITGRQKHDPDEYAEMKAYLHSEEYRADLERLKNGDYFFAPPFPELFMRTWSVRINKLDQDAGSVTEPSGVS